MNLIFDLFKGMILLSFLSVAQHGCTVKNMATKAAESHQNGLTNYGKYSRLLTGEKKSWVDAKN